MASHCPEVHNSKTSIEPRRASQELLVVNDPPANAGDARDSGSAPGWADPVEEEMATPSSILAWKLPWAEEPG